MKPPVTIEIVLPPRLEGLLGRDKLYLAAISQAISELSPWYADNKSPFFPEFTDHGTAHINNVLNGVEWLIPASTYNLLSASDAAVVIGAVLLHDCVMQLNVDGFNSLMAEASSDTGTIFDVADQPWEEEWTKFQHEVTRWDGRKLLSIFGDTEPAPRIDLPVQNINERQRLVIGEFLRRHHARLAHEIALLGIPGAEGKSRVCLFQSLSKNIRDLIGFVARSHNLNMRAAVDLLPKESVRVYLWVHVPYTMALLRIADYLQIDSTRAPKQILNLRALRSPVSREEWAKHDAVYELHPYGDDPEALQVTANPESLAIFAGLRKLLRSIQAELDETWATLGEVYGRVAGLQELGLSIRRIRSNLDDTAIFERNYKPKYVAQEVRLETAGAELLKLLIRPLYGDRPEVGVRELMQNAIDATLERARYIEHHGLALSYVPAVHVDLFVSSDSKASLVVKDNGVGMQIDTIRHYFLTIGASFRRSKWWRSEFVDAENHATVLRTGRFGIGALASFLVGSRAKVLTKSFQAKENEAILFEFGVDDSLIELRRVPIAADFSGTEISIEINDAATIKKLLGTGEIRTSIDWYCLASPIVKICIHRAEEIEEIKPRVLIDLNAKDQGWMRVDAPGFDGVFWSYSVKRRASEYRYSDSNFLSCNGIFVSHPESHSTFQRLQISPGSPELEVRHPSLHVVDKDGRFPLNLQRDGLAASRYPFQRELELSISAVAVSNLLDARPEFRRDTGLLGRIFELGQKFRRSFEQYESRYGFGIFLYSHVGWLPIDRYLISLSKPSSVVLELLNFEAESGVLECKSLWSDEDRVLLPVLGDANKKSNIEKFVRLVLETPNNGWHGGWITELFAAKVAGVRLFMKDHAYEIACEKGRVPKFIMNNAPVADYVRGWTFLQSPDCPSENVNWRKLIEEAMATNANCFAVIYFSDWQIDVAQSPFAEIWEKEIRKRDDPNCTVASGSI